MKINLNILFSVLLISFSALSFAQENDSLISLNHKYDSILSSDDFFLDVLFYKQQNDVLLNNLGPFGSPSYTPTTFGLFSNNRFYLNQNTKNAISILDGVKPYTNVSYINASRKEQLISISHYQKLGKAVRFGFNYTRLSSPGSYINQEMNNTLFDVSLGYVSMHNIYA